MELLKFCILCESDRIRKVTQIDRHDIIKLYRKALGLGVEGIIISDIVFYECYNCGLKFFNPPYIGNEYFYNNLQKFEWYYLKDKYEFHYAKKYIDRNDKVLDIGCGRGDFAKVIGILDRYTGLELSSIASKLALQSGINVINETLEEHAIKNQEKYDVVCSFQVLEHVSNPRQFIQSMLDCLKIGGVMIMSLPSNDSFFEICSE